MIKNVKITFNIFDILYKIKDMLQYQNNLILHSHTNYKVIKLKSYLNNF